LRLGRAITGPSARLTLFLSSLFCCNGMTLPYLGRWLEETHGLSGVEIAAIVASAQLTRVFAGPVIAAWADDFADRRTPLRILAVLSLALYAVFFSAQGFLALLATGFLAQTAAQAITPLVEGALLRMSGHGGLPYGVARAMGSIAFVAGNVGGAMLVGRFGVGAAVVWALASLTAAAMSALFALEHDPADRNGAPGGVRGRLREGLALFRNPAFAAPVIAASLIQCTHAFYYGFSTLVWTKQGLSDPVIGALWGVAVVIEIGLLLALPRFERRFSPEALILFGAIASVVRWGAMAFLPPVLLLWPLQALHALTFAAVHVGALRLVQREAPPAIAGVAQTLYAALASGTLAGLAMLLAGVLYDSVGAFGYTAMSALGGAGLVVMLVLRRRRAGGTPAGA
jgi:MFS transporter, PPP family, 3-phenylpropionic acid transporter